MQLQKEDFIRLGVLGEWNDPYLSMDPYFEANTVRSLATIIDNKHLIRGQKPVHWCPACGSALAEAEVEYKDKQSPAIDVAFNMIDNNQLSEAFEVNKDDLTTTICFPIWTTTPWTIPANQAVCLHPDIEYSLVKISKEGATYLMVCAKELVDSTMERINPNQHQILSTTVGNKLEGIHLQHPFMDRHVPVILGEHVTTEAGTGCVHTAPAHGQDDYIVGQQYNLPTDTAINAESRFNNDIATLSGMSIPEGNKKLLEMMQENQTLLAHDTIQHSYPHCWRHKIPLIFRATPQWFISMDNNGLRDLALKTIKTIHWEPEWGETRIHNMIKNRPDWCISRQRTWGTPMCFIIDKEKGELHPRMPELLHQIADLIEQDGMETWHDLDLNNFLGEEADLYMKTADTLDVWFDSGSTHTTVLRHRAALKFPADIYLEGSDQHRGWFQSSLLTSLALYGEAPYKTVLTHGYVVDAKGLKMSKSLGNVVAPSDVTKKYGADVLRLWVASVNFRDDLHVSDEILQRISDAYRRIRNTTRYLLANIADFDPTQHAVPPKDMIALDCWAVDQAYQLQQKIITAYNEFQFQSIYQMLHNFCSQEMGSFYLDIIKDRQYTAKKDSPARRSAQTAMWLIAEAMVRWLAPILSYTADEIWQFLPNRKQESVFLDQWFQGLFELGNNQPLTRIQWDQLIILRDEINKVFEVKRHNDAIGSALDAKVTIYCSEDSMKFLQPLQEELRFILICSEVTLHLIDKKPENIDFSNDDIAVRVECSLAPKCVRCWQHRPDIGSNSEHPELCSRCIENIVGSGELREYA